MNCLRCGINGDGSKLLLSCGGVGGGEWLSPRFLERFERFRLLLGSAADESAASSSL